MFCSKKMKVIAGIAFVLSQTLSVFAADPFAEYDVSESDIANYFFYEEGSNIELIGVDGTRQTSRLYRRVMEFHIRSTVPLRMQTSQ